MLENIAQTSGLFFLMMLVLPPFLKDELDPPYWFKAIVVVLGCLGGVGLMVSLIMLIWKV